MTVIISALSESLPATPELTEFKNMEMRKAQRKYVTAKNVIIMPLLLNNCLILSPHNSNLVCCYQLIVRKSVLQILTFKLYMIYLDLSIEFLKYITFCRFAIEM